MPYSPSPLHVNMGKVFTYSKKARINRKQTKRLSHQNASDALTQVQKETMYSLRLQKNVVNAEI